MTDVFEVIKMVAVNKIEEPIEAMQLVRLRGLKTMDVLWLYCLNWAMLVDVLIILTAIWEPSEHCTWNFYLKIKIKPSYRYMVLEKKNKGSTVGRKLSILKFPYLGHKRAKLNFELFKFFDKVIESSMNQIVETVV